MTATSEYYLNCAMESASQASETNLVNVRERCLRSEQAWRAMAERVRQVETGKKSRTEQMRLGQAHGS